MVAGRGEGTCKVQTAQSHRVLAPDPRPGKSVLAVWAWLFLIARSTGTEPIDLTLFLSKSEARVATHSRYVCDRHPIHSILSLTTHRPLSLHARSTPSTLCAHHSPGTSLQGRATMAATLLPCHSRVSLPVLMTSKGKRAALMLPPP